MKTVEYCHGHLKFRKIILVVGQTRDRNVFLDHYTWRNPNFIDVENES